MDLTKEALQYIADSGKTEIIKIDEQTYSSRNLHHVKIPSPAALSISTLTGLVDYIKKNVDKLDESCLMVHIMDYNRVELISHIQNDSSRDCFMESVAKTPSIIFERFLPVENFNIMMQSAFIPDDTTDCILSIVGNIQEENVRNTGDDGVSQTVTARTGIAKVGNIQVPNPVILRPFRTFIEVEQPASKFIFRMQDGPQAALFEADGGAWKAEVMANIKWYLEDELKDTGVSIIS